MSDPVSLKARFERLHGFWNDALDIGLNEDPAFFDRYLSMAEVALGSPHLEPKIRHFVLIAANASVTHLNAEAVGHHIDAAVKHGATRAELREVLQIASVLGIHAYMVGVPILLEELAAAGESVDAAFPLDSAFDKVRTEFCERRGYWSDELQGMVRSSPAFFDGYTAFRRRRGRPQRCRPSSRSCCMWQSTYRRRTCSNRASAFICATRCATARRRHKCCRSCKSSAVSGCRAFCSAHRI